jgi:hypothetical protein
METSDARRKKEKHAELVAKESLAKVKKEKAGRRKNHITFGSRLASKLSRCQILLEYDINPMSLIDLGVYKLRKRS